MTTAFLNAIAMIEEQFRLKPDAPALWMPSCGIITYRMLFELSERLEGALLAKRIAPSATVLLVLEFSPLLYATILALARRGSPMLLIEPWMPLSRINETIDLLKPQVMIGGVKGFAWGLRSRAIRNIGCWISAYSCLRASPVKSTVTMVAGDHPCIISFTSGTSGRPKGAVRSHAYFVDLFKAIDISLCLTRHGGSDLCIFANFALANLSSGKCSILMPGPWNERDIKVINALPRDLAPKSATIGPAYLRKILAYSQMTHMERLNVGGALSDITLFEQALKKWPHVHFEHVYGSTEVEPVAHVNAQKAVDLSRDAGYFQVLYLGPLHTQLKAKVEGDSFWVCGPQVGSEYLNDAEANFEIKRRDASGNLWHRMGDRIDMGENGLWYQGRETQAKEDFFLEQKLYIVLGHSNAIIYRDVHNQQLVIGEDLEHRVKEIREIVPDLAAIYRGKIKYDPRHHARIDRPLTRKGKLCRVG